MWMKSQFARWEVEGQVEERIQRALREGEQWRLARMARGVEAGHSHARFLASVSKGLSWFGKCVTGWLVGQVDATVSKPAPAGRNHVRETRAASS